MTPPLGPFLLEDLHFTGCLHALFGVPAFLVWWLPSAVLLGSQLPPLARLLRRPS